VLVQYIRSYKFSFYLIMTGTHTDVFSNIGIDVKIENIVDIYEQ